jgi:hypothetical protein
MAPCRAARKATRQGAILNEVADRAGDFFILSAGFFVAPVLVSGAVAVLVITTELLGAVGWAVTGNRVLDGPMAKPDSGDRDRRRSGIGDHRCAGPSYRLCRRWGWSGTGSRSCCSGPEGVDFQRRS